MFVCAGILVVSGVVVPLAQHDPGELWVVLLPVPFLLAGACGYGRTGLRCAPSSVGRTP